ncbi:multifunctional aminopeptidase A, partial [Mycolicibacterium fortuitum subsp. fortuitum DSM 46621 = ATCC 6841 = JCM 6387]
MSSAPGYQAPTVTVSSSLPRKGVAEAVLVIGVVSDDDGPKVLSAGSFLDEDAVAAVESTLQALGGTGSEGQTHRLVVPSLPVASVLTVGLGKPRDEW